MGVFDVVLLCLVFFVGLDNLEVMWFFMFRGCVCDLVLCFGDDVIDDNKIFFVDLEIFFCLVSFLFIFLFGELFNICEWRFVFNWWVFCLFFFICVCDINVVGIVFELRFWLLFLFDFSLFGFLFLLFKFLDIFDVREKWVF